MSMRQQKAFPLANIETNIGKTLLNVCQPTLLQVPVRQQQETHTGRALNKPELMTPLLSGRCQSS